MTEREEDSGTDRQSNVVSSGRCFDLEALILSGQFVSNSESGGGSASFTQLGSTPGLGLAVFPASVVDFPGSCSGSFQGNAGWRWRGGIARGCVCVRKSSSRRGLVRQGVGRGGAGVREISSGIL